MERRIILSPPAGGHALLLVGVASLLLLMAASLGNLLLVYKIAGYSDAEALAFALTTVILALALSPVNVPVAEYRVRTIVPVLRRVRFLWFTMEIPEIVFRLTRTVVAVNMGGCIIPLAVASSLVTRAGFEEPRAVAAALLSAGITGIMVYPASRIVEGVGVIVPGFYPPLTAAVVGVTVARALGAPLYAPLVAYAAGVYGTLLGADLLNLRRMVGRGVPLISIGGMGTFDGIYLTGIVSISLAVLLGF